MSYASVVAADGPILWWRLNTAPFNAGVIADASGHGRVGTLNNNLPSASPGLVVGDANVPNVATNLDNITSNSLSFGGPSTGLSVEFWIRPSAGQPGNFFMGGIPLGPGVGGVDALLTAAGTLEFGLTSTGGNVGAQIAAPSNLVVGTLYYVVFTYDDLANVGKLYLNANLVATLANMRPGGAGWDKGVQHFDVAAAGLGNNWYSKLQEIAVYDKVLTPAQILTHNNAGFGIVPPVWLFPYSPPLFPVNTGSPVVYQSLRRSLFAEPQPKLSPYFPVATSLLVYKSLRNSLFAVAPPKLSPYSPVAAGNPPSTTQKQNWTAALQATAAQKTSYVDPQTTQAQVDKVFKIIDMNLVAIGKQ